MCKFPSWIESDDGTVTFLTDKDIERLMQVDGASQDWADYVGHNAIEKAYGTKGRHCEGAHIPYELQRAILVGECRRMAKAAGYDAVFLRGKHTVRDGVVIALEWSEVTVYGKATVEAYGRATVTAYGRATVFACDRATVEAHDSAIVFSYDSSMVNRL